VILIGRLRRGENKEADWNEHKAGQDVCECTKDIDLEEWEP
jgi:hypothetical protein